MSGAGKAWDLLVASCTQAFTAPSATLFHELVGAWVLCPMRRTVTGMIRMIGTGRRAHDAYHRFLRAGAWSMPRLWKVLAVSAVRALCPGSVLTVDVDDTLFHKTGRKMEGAGVFRDPIRSSARRVVYALGLNLVVATLRVVPPWGGEPLGLPINVRLHTKQGAKTTELAVQMLSEIAGWFPGRRLEVSCDGAYACLAGYGLERTHVTSRMRRDAAVFEPAPPPTGRRGRPRKKGERLPSLEKMARVRKGWTLAAVDVRGKPVQRLLLARPVLWYSVLPERQVLLVVVRDPEGKQSDDFFFTTDLDATPAHVAANYAGRWSIEDTFRAVKQSLGGQQPQSWKHKGPERAAALSLWIYTAVWLWYLTTQGTRPSWPKLPWYSSKRTPSFADALAALRRVLWRQRIFPTSHQRRLTPKIANTLIEALARAA